MKNSAFTKSDFEVELPKFGRTLIKITFLYKPEYSLILTEEEREESYTVKSFDLSSRSEKRKYKIYKARLAPGKFKALSEPELDDIGELLEIVPKWCDYIRDDLYALAPTKDPLEELRRKLKDDITEMVEHPEKYFTDEELSVVAEKFDRLFDEISKLKDEHSLTKQQLDSIQREFEEFKSSAKVYPKGIWAKVTSNKLVSVTGKVINTPEGRTFLFQQIKRLLSLGSGE